MTSPDSAANRIDDSSRYTSKVAAVFSPSLIIAYGTGGIEFVTLLDTTPPIGFVTTIDFKVSVQNVALTGLKYPRLHIHLKSEVSCSKTLQVIKLQPTPDAEGL
jgi:hypothetical protein